MSNLSNAIEQFHVFSKTPVSSSLGLGQAVNRGGHTVSLSDVLGDDLPFFSKDQFISMADAKDALNGVARENDIIQVGNEIVKRANGSWTPITLNDGDTLQNKDGADVLLYHKGVRLEAVTAGNNSGTSSQGDSKGGKECYFAGRIRKAGENGELVQFFIGVNDKILAGLPSLGYKPTLEVESETTTEIIQAEGTDYWINPYAGIVVFEAARPISSASVHKNDELCIKISCFEYIGKMADETKQNAFKFVKETDTELEKRLELGGNNASILIEGPIRFNDAGQIMSNREMIRFGGHVNPYLELQALNNGGYAGTIALNTDTIFINGPLHLAYDTNTIFNGDWLYKYGNDLYWGASKLNSQSGTTYRAGQGIYIDNSSNTISIQRNGGESSGLILSNSGLSLNFDYFSWISFGPSSLLIDGPEVFLKQTRAEEQAESYIHLSGGSLFIKGPSEFNNPIKISSNGSGSSGDFSLSNNNGKLYWNGKEVGANYQAGSGISISGNTISVDTSVIQPKLQYITDGAKLRLGTNGTNVSNSITIEGPLFIKNDTSTYNQLIVKTNDVDGTIINPDYVTQNEFTIALDQKQNKLYFLSENTSSISIGNNGGSILMNGPISILANVPTTKSGKLYRNNDDLYWGNQKLNGQEGKTYSAGTNIEISNTNVISTKDDVIFNSITVVSPIFNGPIFIKSIGPSDDLDGYLYNLNDMLYWGTRLINGPQFTLIKEEGTDIVIGPKDNPAGSIELHAYDSIFINGPKIEIGSDYDSTSIFIKGPLYVSDGITIDSNLQPSITNNTLYNNGGTLYWNGNPVGSTYSGTSPISVSDQTISLSYDGTYLKLVNNKLTINTANVATKADLTLKQDSLTYLTEDSSNLNLQLGVGGANSVVVDGPFVLKNSDSYDYTQLSVKANVDPSVVVSDPYVTHNELSVALSQKQNTLNYISENDSSHSITLGANTTVNGKLTLNQQTTTSTDLTLYRNGNDVYWGSSKLNNQGGGGTTYTYITENQNTSITLGSTDHKVSILFDGPSTFVRDGIGIPSSVPASTSDRLYNNNGDLYWNNTKLNGGGSTFNFIQEGGDWLRLGPSAKDVTVSGSRSVSIEGPNQSQIKLASDGISIKTKQYDDVSIFIQGPRYYSSIKLQADGINLSYTAIFIGPSETEINNRFVQFGFDNNETTVTFNGPVSLTQALQLIENVPSDTTWKLYNNNGELFWNGNKLNDQPGTTYTFYSPLHQGPSTNIITLELASDSNLEVDSNGALKVKASSFASATQLSSLDSRVTTLEENLNGVSVKNNTENNDSNNILQGSLFDIHNDGDIITVDSETDLSGIMLQQNSNIEVHVKSLTPYSITWNEAWKWSGTPLETTEANTYYIIQIRHDVWNNVVCKVTHQYN